MVVVWAGNITAVRVLVTGGVGPITAAAFRFVLALGAILGYARYTKQELRLKKGEFKHFIPLILFFVMQILLFNFASKYTDSGRVGVILNAYPFWITVVAGYIFLEDKHSMKGVIGSLVAVAGVTAIFWESFITARSSLLGDTLIFISSLLLAGIIIFGKILLKKGFHPLQVLTYQITGGLPCYFAAALVFEFPLRFNAVPMNIFAILYQGLVVGGMAFIIFQNMNRIYPTSKLSSFFFLVPFFSVLYGSILLKEPVTPGLIVGLVLITSGIYFVNK